MKIAILHLSDLHIQDQSVLSRIDCLVKAVEYDIKQITHMYLVLSGDIVNSGRKIEFDFAKTFVLQMVEKLKEKWPILNVKFIMVPGNHDCCFDDAKKTRKSILADCRTDTMEEEDYFNDAMAVQYNFWNFVNELTEFQERNKVSYKYEFQPRIDFKLSFHCYNTSWLTEIPEKQGSLTIPENKFIDNKNGEYVVSVFHHPVDWLSANTKRNNKQRFEEHLINTSNLVIYGHEHDKGNAKAVRLGKNDVVFCGGKAFSAKDLTETGFSLYQLDLKDKSIIAKTYCFKGEYYLVEFDYDFKVNEKDNRNFILKKDFEKAITDLSVPLKHSRKSNLVLSDVFVFPDLEPLFEDNVTIIQYPNSSELIEKVKNEGRINIFIEGSDQSGKTSLLYVLYKRYYEMGLTPIYLRGEDCNHTDVKKLTKKCLKKQYDDKNVDLFFQNDKKVLLLDNFHKSNLNSKYKKRLIESLERNFDVLLITSDSVYSSRNATEEVISFKDYLKYKLLPLGHEKRCELIEQWILIGENKLTVREEELISNVKFKFEQINSLIGNRLMPTYPIFILILLQGLEESLLSYSETSYANIYLVLIKAGLIKEGVKDNALTSLLNALRELAFHMFNEKMNSFKRKDFDEFIADYLSRYYLDKSLTNDNILNVLCKSNILKMDDEYYAFSYKYIYYFLVAQRIATDIDGHKILIYELCNNIHLEINANILIFLSHHSRAQILIDSIVFASNLPFEEYPPLTLNSDEEFVKFVSEFTKEIKNEIIEDKNPKEEIKKELKRKDALERNNHEFENQDGDGWPSEVIEMNQAFRTVKIIGQIVKNQSGDFEKEKLISLVDAGYNTIFRFLGFYAKMLEKDRDLFVDAIVGEIKKKVKERKDGAFEVEDALIEKQVRKILQLVSFRVCVESMTSLMFAVGTRGQNELFDEVNLRINTTASKIITFAIKTLYDKIDIKEMEELFKDVEHNYFAQFILKVYIKRYIYTNYVELGKRDQIIQIAGFNKKYVLGKMKTD